MPDAFSDVLRLIQLKSCVYFLRDFSTPWGMAMQAGEVAQFHAVLRGQCVVTVDGQTFQGVAGDIFLFPKGAAHVISDASECRPVSGPEFMQSLSSETPLFADGPAATQLLCGHYEYRHDIRHPLMEELPDVIHVQSTDPAAPQDMADIIRVLVREMNGEAPGSNAVIEKLAEILLVLIIRINLPGKGSQTAFMKGLSDPRLARAIHLIHQSPELPLTLGDMAAAAGMSRSSLAFHFRVKTGTTPRAYLTLWRMCLARDFMQGQGLTVSQSAHRVGYESEVAFSRAFRRHFGISPSKVRAKTA